MRPEPADALALRALSDGYARAVDRRDRDELLGVFAPDGRLIIHRDGVEHELSGAERLGGIVVSIARYERTFHFVGNALYDVDGDRADGEVYCIAHHLRAGRDLVLMIRYQDAYRRDGDAWRIVTRDLHQDWSEERPAGDH